MQLQEALGQFQVQLRADGRSEHTRKQYQRHVTSLIAWLKRSRHPTDIRQVTPGLVAEFLASDAAGHRATGAPKTSTSMNCLRSSIRAFCRWVHEAGLTQSNPARLLKRARCASPPPRFLHADEQERLLATLNDASGKAAERDRILTLVLLRVGLRIGSAVSLNVEDVDLEHAEITLRHAKNNAPNVAVLPTVVVEELRQFIGARSTGPLFLAGSRRVSVRQCQRRISSWMARSGIAGKTPHSLRHSFAASLLAKTGDLRLVQGALHHKCIASTTTYTHLDRARLRSVLD